MASSLVSIKPNVTGASWNSVPASIGYKMTSTTLVDSARNTKGFVVANVIREGIRKIELNWNYLTVAEFSALAKLFEGANTGGVGGFFFYVKYFDTIIGQHIDSEHGFTGLDNVVYGSTEPRLFYVGDRITDTAQIKLDANYQPIGYTGVKLSLIEV